MYLIEPYKEFLSDVTNSWHSLIEKHNFKINQKNESTLKLDNDVCEILLLLKADQRIYYKFINPLSNVDYDPIVLFIFFGKNIDMLSVGASEYPLSLEEWVKYFANDDYRGLCMIDLPIIRDEIIRNWKFILKGDFTFERDYLRWKIWYDRQDESVSPEQLSYEKFKRDINNEII